MFVDLACLYTLIIVQPTKPEILSIVAGFSDPSKLQASGVSLTYKAASNAAPLMTKFFYVSQPSQNSFYCKKVLKLDDQLHESSH